ncbi:MAG TPA: LysR family transcriptional regulator [Xanthobacteraceae bacterium]|nr:LysR family transcriptional regulator [Xanthobacteraceae bacterium]
MQRSPHTSRRLKLRQLEVLLSVAQWGGMAKAAQHLAISQPVVSKTIADLENALGVRLFDRTPQGVEPTLYGRALLKRSLAIFDDLKTSVSEIEFLADPTAGQLRIGCSEIMAAGFVAAVIERLSSKHRRIDFHVEQATSATLIDRLRERHDELMIGRLPKPFLDADLTTTILYHDRLRVVAGLQSRWASRRKITLADLVDEPWCVPSPDTNATGSQFADAFRASGLTVPRIVVTAVSAQLATSLLAHGRFLGILGESSFMHFNAKRLSLKTLPIELPTQPYPVAIVILKNRTISPVAQLFIECAHEIAKPLGIGGS